MKKTTKLIIAIILFILAAIIIGITILFLALDGFMCGQPLYVINGSNGPIPTCISFFNTDFIWPPLVGVILIIFGIIFMKSCKKNNINK